MLHASMMVAALLARVSFERRGKKPAPIAIVVVANKADIRRRQVTLREISQLLALHVKVDLFLAQLRRQKMEKLVSSAVEAVLQARS